MTAENAPRFAEDLCLSPPPAPARLFLPSGVLSIASLGSFSVSGVSTDAVPRMRYAESACGARRHGIWRRGRDIPGGFSLQDPDLGVQHGSL